MTSIPTQHPCARILLLGTCLFGWMSLSSPVTSTGQDIESKPDTTLDEVVVAAFRQTYGGWSCDEVLLNDELNRSFLQACHRQLPETKAAEFNWRLLTLRKQRRLSGITTKRRRDQHDDYVAVAEIVARRMEDQHGLNIDRVMCDPARRAEFDAAARGLVADVDTYLVRKAAFGLRKARRLQPELITRVTEWKREIKVRPLSEIQADLNSVPTSPGVYIFCSGDGYLYIGESHNLRSRMAQHLDSRNETSLVRLFTRHDLPLNAIRIEIHAFDPQSRAKEVRCRRAYESQLIESRHPRFNVRP